MMYLSKLITPMFLSNNMSFVNVDTIAPTTDVREINLVPLLPDILIVRQKSKFHEELDLLRIEISWASNWVKWVVEWVIVNKDALSVLR